MCKSAMFFFVTLLVMKNLIVCDGISIHKTGTGGLHQGDPAPGRSPGPPVITSVNTDENPIIFTSKSAVDCSFEGDVLPENNGYVNLTVRHSLFRTDVLVFGVVYEIIVTRLRPDATIEFVISSSIEDVPSGLFIFPKTNYICPDYAHRNQLAESSTISLNWTAEEGRHLDKSNVTFTLKYKTEKTSSVHELIYKIPLTQECQLWLKPQREFLTWKDIPSGDCQCWFPGPSDEHGLVIEMTRLNVPCFRGHLYFSSLNTSQHQHARDHKQTRICGKLEELSESDRHVYFPPSRSPAFVRVRGKPVFSLIYHPVDYCYNVTFTTRNGSFDLRPRGELQCTFKINLPYGNRVALNLYIGDTIRYDTPSMSETSTDLKLLKSEETKCQGLAVQLFDGENVWSHCTRIGDAYKQIQMMSKENKVIVKVSVKGVTGGALRINLFYRAEPDENIVATCEFGWVSLGHFCVTANEELKLSWMQAEMECVRNGGHLASISSKEDQEVLDSLLMHSPGYKDYNAYWIGASDKTQEGDFRWSDGSSFSYSNWFPGWSQHGNYNRQPNDDGFSEQNCVETRRIYSLPSSTPSLASSFMWNDRDCATPNYFICERVQNDEPIVESSPQDCNKSVILSRQQERAIVSSPRFPRQYPDYANCITDITAPSGFRIVLDFEELVLENEPSCSYDFLEILEVTSNNTQTNNTGTSRRLCGDWSSKLKLLRHVSKGSKLKLRFNSDYSHHYGGFKARVSMENGNYYSFDVIQCSDDRFRVFNNTCYLFVSYPEVTWNTALHICLGIKAQLTSVVTAGEEEFITTNIRKTLEYRTTSKYWLGGRVDENGFFSWLDGNAMKYSGWIPGQTPKENEVTNVGEPLCLAMQWIPSPAPALPSGLYWKPEKCTSIGGYVCKRPKQSASPGINFNKIVNGTKGQLTTPNYPTNYYNNLDFVVRIIGRERTRIIIHFDKIDLEPQLECLYDYVQIKSVSNGDVYKDTKKLCGFYDKDMGRFDFVSKSHEVELHFHSDYSVTCEGFYLRWYTVDVSGCPEQTLTAKEGIIISPNYPNFLLANLDCTITILAPKNKRIFLQFEDYDLRSQGKLIEEAVLNIQLGNESPPIRPYTNRNVLTEGTFISYAEKLIIHLRTKNQPMGRGFKATYKTLATIDEERIINISNVTIGSVLHLNYPNSPPRNVNFLQHFVAPIGHVISIEIYNAKLTDVNCTPENGVIEVFDNYADVNGTRWLLCYDGIVEDSIIPMPPIAINSFLNTLHLKQTDSARDFVLNATLAVHRDANFQVKLLKHNNEFVESCSPNPCQHGGRCVSKGRRKMCQCPKYYTGLFCALTQCDLEPCVFGTCELTKTSYKCHCRKGYLGPTCEQKRKPCQNNPCEGRGVCVERGDGFQCRCHAWWEGTRCEKRMMRIPYKPLSERMLHEPFWLGLITVTVVMSVIGLFWCAKRHFPEKIEKLLAEDDDRNRSTISSLRSASVREQLAASGSAAVTVTPSPGPGVPRSLFGRLGIRKPSIISLTSPHASGYAPATARTFSLDDLLKPPPRRTPSPKKKRNNSTPTKKNAAEKKQILQQLISPAASRQNSRKVSLGELIQMSERKLSDQKTSENTTENVKETKLTSKEISTGQLSLIDPKLEKKVTFARLLSKVSQEMSSGSDIEMGIMQANKLSCAFARPASTPPSPGATVRSPNSTSSNQGSDSLTSSDLAIPSALSSSVSDLCRKSTRFHNVRQKPSSADSILAMFRNFSSSSAGVNLPSSIRVSPSTTPTASSPQDDVAGDDESSSSSIHTPVSFSSGPPESPILHRQSQSTIEVPVLDPLSAHKSTSSGSNFLHPPTILLEIPSTINKCLSPIREMPTPLPSPMPSPAITPIMRRSALPSPVDDAETSDDRISVELPNISISCSDDDDDDDMHNIQDIAIDPQGEDGLIREEVATMQQGNLKIKARPQPLGHVGENLQIPNIHISGPLTENIIIPTLTIQTPSPTHKKTPYIVFPGSPPPRSNEDSFQFPKSARKLLKEFDKPASLDLPCAPPLITITCNLSEADSDAESISPAIKTSSHLNVSSGGMTYLSPFSMVARGEHNASESNLSSSGYSSMASPGPSRCGSSNPLCPSEMEDPGPPGSGSTNLHPTLRRLSPLLRTSSNINECSNTDKDNEQHDHSRGRSDSETLSDDPMMESNDEGIGTDHIDEKIEEGEVKSAKELEVFICETKTLSKTETLVSNSMGLDDKVDRLLPPVSSKKTLQLPSIIVQCDNLSLEKCNSPVSSRSESPLSDRTSGVGIFSPQFYGRHKDFLPFTDSDGLYDFPSSDKVNVSTMQQHRKSIGRKRDKKLRTKIPSPTKTPPLTRHLDIPRKESVKVLPRKTSPKRRTRPQLASSSSSSESITSCKEVKLSSSSPSPDTIRWSSSMEWPNGKIVKSPEASGEETAEDANSLMLPKSDQDLYRNKKISRLRTISHQIRFLRRLEQSLKKKNRPVSPPESATSGDDSPRATSPLLPTNKEPRIEIRKSSSSGKLQCNTNYVPSRSRRRFTKGELLIPEHDRSWKKIVLTGNGHSD